MKNKLPQIKFNSDQSKKINDLANRMNVNAEIIQKKMIREMVKQQMSEANSENY